MKKSKEDQKVKKPKDKKQIIRASVSIFAIVLSCCLIVGTMFIAKNDTGTSQQMQPPGQLQSSESGTPPEMPSDNSSSDDSDSQNQQSNDSSSDQQTTDNSTNSSSQSGTESADDKKADDKSGAPSSDSDSQPPSMPDGESNGDAQTPPSKPDGESDNSSSSAPHGAAQQPNSASLHWGYYAAFAAESLLLAGAIIYLILTKFGKNALRKAPHAIRKIIIWILSAAVIAASLTFAEGEITKDRFLQGGGFSKISDSADGGQSEPTYSAANEITEDTELDSGSYSSEKSDENALSVSGGIEAALSNISASKSGDSDGGDNSNFYGTNSAIIAKDGASLTLKNATVSTDADGANGVFCYGGYASTNNSSSDGTTVSISDSTIKTTGDNAGGIMTTGGGTTKVSNATVTTSGISSAAIRSDRGGGTVSVDGGKYTTSGAGSPSVYSTADITVSNATLSSTASEGVVIEGANSVALSKCTLTDSNTKLNGESTTYKNIFLYQSVSGDAAEGKAEFSSADCDITTNNGDTFYITNTTASITLENNTIVNNDSDGNFLRAQKDSWGNDGSNGGAVTLVMKNQNAKGNIVIDSISTLDMTMKSGSYFEGAINTDNTAKSISLTLDSSSKIKLTGDTYVTSLDDADSSYSNIDFNGYTLYVNSKAIN